ncbi:hypothetical protein [Candidatus Methylopumilus planktonicus]|uniref:hypothetical protein n=1 Tax=Candidatus Methylopumilus planktonicus TaxID=1581557 RepID=UPI003D18AF9C
MANKKKYFEFGGEMSLEDFIFHFKLNKKLIIIFTLISGALGFFYGSIVPPDYHGEVLISPSKVSNLNAVELRSTAARMLFDDFFDKETLLECHTNQSTTESVNNKAMSRIVKISVDGDYIKIEMNSRDKNIINNCLNKVSDSINKNEHLIFNQLRDEKQIDLQLNKEKLKLFQDFIESLTLKEKNSLNFNGEEFQKYTLHQLIVFDISQKIMSIKLDIIKIQRDLSPLKTYQSYGLFPIKIEKNYFPSPQLGLLLGIFLGFSLSVTATLLKSSWFN